MVRTLFMVFVLIGLVSCNPGSINRQGTPFDPYSQTTIEQNSEMIMVGEPTPHQQQLQSYANGKIALLLPLTGRHADVGQSMLNAAQLALFDINDATLELMPIDTQGTSRGAAQAVEKAANANVRLVIGPLLADSVQAAGQTARRYNLQVVGFTTDWNKVGNNIFTMGILPFDQGARLAQFANKSGKNRVVIIDPKTSYSRAVIHAFEQNAQPQNLRIIDKISLTNPNQIATALGQRSNDFDTIIMPFGNPQASQMMRALSDNGLTPNTVTLMGAGLWDDPSIKSNPVFNGAIYTAPPPSMRDNFNRQYQSVYGVSPKRLASLAYDATALSAVLLRQNQGHITRTAILNGNGFAGIDGIFKFQNNGMVIRGLAIHKINSGGQAAMMDAAPSSF